MRIELPTRIQEKLRLALEKAGRREIGGVLMGEHIGEAEFRLVDLTIQRHGGGIAFFVRMVEEAIVSLRSFFTRTGEKYRRFNYLGEWHSHPCFTPHPSAKDIQSMLEIVTDREVGANFAVLLVVRLGSDQQIEATATAFFPNQVFFECELVPEGAV